MIERANYGPGPLPRHIYCHVDRSHTRRDGAGFEPCVWFGLAAHPGRAWGCHVMLACGAVYRSVPLHALAAAAEPDPDWDQSQAQSWDCYGYGWTGLVYPYLDGLTCSALCGRADVTGVAAFGGDYLFTVAPVGDAYSASPDQSKEFVFVELDNGRYTAQPTNRVLFKDRSFTDPTGWPTDMRLQTDYWSCEE